MKNITFVLTLWSYTLYSACFFQCFFLHQPDSKLDNSDVKVLMFDSRCQQPPFLRGWTRYRPGESPGLCLSGPRGLRGDHVCVACEFTIMPAGHTLILTTIDWATRRSNGERGWRCVQHTEKVTLKCSEFVPKQSAAQTKKIKHDQKNPRSLPPK